MILQKYVWSNTSLFSSLQSSITTTVKWGDITKPQTISHTITQLNVQTYGTNMLFSFVVIFPVLELFDVSPAEHAWSIILSI